MLTTITMIQVVTLAIVFMSLQIAWNGCKLLNMHWSLRRSAELSLGSECISRKDSRITISKEWNKPLKYILLVISIIMAVWAMVVVVDIITINALIHDAWYVVILMGTVLYHIFVDGLKSQTHCDILHMQYGFQKEAHRKTMNESRLATQKLLEEFKKGKQ